MTLKDAENYFRQYLLSASKKSEKKLAQQFLDLLLNLEHRNLSERELQSIQDQLSAFDLDTSKPLPKKQLKKIFEEFKKYLREQFSLFTKGYYINMGVGLGTLFGISIGVVFGQEGMTMGICFGMLAGVLIGRRLELQAKALGNLL